MARMLGTWILAKCGEIRHQLSLESYDRFFPSQDYCPRGGFGNLIALPLQKIPRVSGNSCFLNDDLQVIDDPWTYLAQVRCLSLIDLQTLLDKHLPKLVSKPRDDEFNDVGLLADRSLIELNLAHKTVSTQNLQGEMIEVIHAAQIHIPLIKLPNKLVNQLKRLASFPNPKFYELQRMRMQTYPHQRFVFSGELQEYTLILPRGLLNAVLKLLTGEGAQVIIRDERQSRRITARFIGDLTPIQQKVVIAMKSFESGILVAPPGAGKTVMGCALISERKVNTLVLVHRQPLLEQWKSALQTFLGLQIKDIGILGGNSKKKTTGMIDLAMLQTLTRLEDLDDIRHYGQIIIDECHHIPATSFEWVMKQLPARYIVGLTATPYRKDGLEKILFYQCGPIRHEMSAIDGGILKKRAIIKETGFRFPDNLGPKPPYPVLIQCLVTHTSRNALIAQNVVEALDKQRFPLLISDRKDHLDLLSQEITKCIAKVPQRQTFKIIRLDGDLTTKQRKDQIAQAYQAQEQNTPVLIIATASLIGEGFDLPALDTLILAMPLSFSGRLVQYAGRLHRLTDKKRDVMILDYLDGYSAMFLKMYRKRLRTYKKMGYDIVEPMSLF